MFRSIRQKFRDLVDTIRFLPKVKRRRIYLTSTVIATMSTTGLYVMFQTSHLDSLVKQLQMYRFKMPIPINEKLYELIKDVISDEDMALKTNNPLYLFNFFGSDIYSIGNLTLPTGAYIGVPFNYNFDSISQLSPDDIRLMGRYKTKRTINSPVMKKLFQSLILSDDAKRYSFAHELQLLTSSYFYVKTLNIMAYTWFYMWIVPKFNKRIGLHDQKPFRLLPRLMGGTLCLVFVLFMAVLTDQMWDHLFDLRSLKQVIQHPNGEQYRKGAEEFYEKLIQRNQAMYELLGEHGPSFYTEDGQIQKLFGLYSISFETHLALLASRKNKSL